MRSRSPSAAHFFSSWKWRRQQLYDVTRVGAIEAVFRYPEPGPGKFFWWLRETIAWRALEHLRGELPELRNHGASREEVTALQLALHGFEDIEQPPMREAAGWASWCSLYPGTQIWLQAVPQNGRGTLPRDSRWPDGPQAPGSA